MRLFLFLLSFISINVFADSIEPNLKWGKPTKEVPMRLNDGTRVRKDFVKPDGTSVIIKPETPSGYKFAQKREKLMQ